MLIDAHQHFWHYNPAEYSWISDSMNILKNDFLPETLEPELKKLRFDGSVAVQARQSYEETRWLLRLSAEYDFIKGVVGWIDLCSENAEKELLELSSNRKLAGVRHVLQDEPDDNFMLRDDFMHGIDLMGKFNLAYDLLIFPRHLRNTIRLVEKFPEQTFVLDHMAKPQVKDRLLEPWKEGVVELARHGNVFCKLSGLVTEASWRTWTKDDFEPYLKVVFDSFGSDRLMIGSDWPVCMLASDYGGTMQIIIDYIAHLNQKEKALILGETALNVYNIPFE